MPDKSLVLMKEEIESFGQVDEIIQGGAKGADALALRVASSLKIPCTTFKADWATHGKGAGPIRNQQMIEEKPDYVLAFKPKSGITKGTQDMVDRAIKAGIPVALVEYGDLS